MQITKKITIDLAKRGIIETVDAMQGDSNTRAVEITLLDNGVAWNIPADTSVVVGYRKPDATNGKYDTLPDGSSATSIAGNAVTVTLAPQVLTAPGKVFLSVSFLDGLGAQLATFPVIIMVIADPSADVEQSDDYFNLVTYLPQPSGGAAVGQFLEINGVAEDGRVTAVKAVDAPQGSHAAVLYTPQDLTPEQQAQARENIGAAMADETSIKCVLDVSANLINPADIQLGGYFNIANGVVNSSDNHGYSGYVRVNAGTTYCIVNDGAWQMLFYDVEKKFLSGITGGSNTHSFVTPDEAKYFRVSTWASSIYDTTVSQTSVDTYVPYYEPNITFLNPLNADSVEWVRKSVWNGTYNDDSTAISSEMFFMLAGSKITFSNAYKVRITVFDTSKNYMSNTGSFAYMEEYDIPYDCYIAVSLDGTEKVPLSAGSSANVKFLAYEKIIQKTDEEIENDVVEKVKKNMFNSVYSDIEDIFTTKLSEFAGHAISTGAVEQFAFATDFHTIDRQDNWQENHRRILSNVQRIYNNSPANFIVFGGDWLSSGLNVSDLCTKLGFLKGNIQNMFRNGYAVVGNHDICYEGGKINEQAMSNALFGGAGCYYSFDGAVSKCYALDTGYDNDLNMTAYRWGQIDWFANRLIEDDHTNTLVFMHVYTRAETADAVNADSVHPVARAVVDLASAFNKRTSVTINGITYDFADCTGKVRCIITGHTHFDCDLVDNDVPIVCCDMALREVDGVPTFDLCSADYGTNTLYLTRVGRGSNRSIIMAT